MSRFDYVAWSTSLKRRTTAYPMKAGILEIRLRVVLFSLADEAEHGAVSSRRRVPPKRTESL